MGGIRPCLPMPSIDAAYDNTPPTALTASREFIRPTYVRVAGTANLNLASTLTALDGVTLADGDLVLLKDQTDKTENGCYLYNATSDLLERPGEGEPGYGPVVNQVYTAREGTAGAGKVWLLTSNQDPIVVDTSQQTLTAQSTAGAARKIS